MNEDSIYDLSNVPDNSIKLNDVETQLLIYSKKLEKYKKKEILDYNEINKLDNNIYNCLLYLGELSKPVFNLMDSIEETYYKHPKYKGNPNKAKKDWLAFYRGLHGRYDFLKNRAHRLMNKLEARFPSELRCKYKNYEYI